MHGRHYHNFVAYGKCVQAAQLTSETSSNESSNYPGSKSRDEQKGRFQEDKNVAENNFEWTGIQPMKGNHLFVPEGISSHPLSRCLFSESAL